MSTSSIRSADSERTTLSEYLRSGSSLDDCEPASEWWQIARRDGVGDALERAQQFYDSTALLASLSSPVCITLLLQDLSPVFGALWRTKHACVALGSLSFLALTMCLLLSMLLSNTLRRIPRDARACKLALRRFDGQLKLPSLCFMGGTALNVAQISLYILGVHGWLQCLLFTCIAAPLGLRACWEPWVLRGSGSPFRRLCPEGSPQPRGGLSTHGRDRHRPTRSDGPSPRGVLGSPPRSPS